VVERANAAIRALAAGSIVFGGEAAEPAPPSVAELERRVLARPADAVTFDPDFNYVDTSDDRLTPVMNSDGFLTIEAHHYEYGGGAHGNYGFAYTVIDLTTGDVVRLADIANEGYAEKWAALGAAELRRQAGAKPDASLEEAGLFENKLELNETWYLLPGGIGFSYDPYEIGSYARGQVGFLLEWKDILQDLKPGTRVHALASRHVGKPRQP
jgi:hypothetical protein